MQKIKLNKKWIATILIVVFVVASLKNKHDNDIADAKAYAQEAEKIKKGLKVMADQDLYKFSHSMYLNNICQFDGNLTPVSEILTKIKDKTAIPPDLVSIVKDFNESTKFLTTSEDIFLGKESKMTVEELKIKNFILLFAKELNIKTTELEQGLITSSNPYWITLKSKMNNFVAPACEQYGTLHPEKPQAIIPAPSPPQIVLPNSKDSILDKIDKQVAYDGVCKLKTSATNLKSDIENVKSSKAFNPALLESTKQSIYDLHYASFSFSNDGLYSPSLNEIELGSQFETLRQKVEKIRYNFWSTNSASSLDSLEKAANQMLDWGMLGCKSVEKLKSQTVG